MRRRISKMASNLIKDNSSRMNTDEHGFGSLSGVFELNGKMPEVLGTERLPNGDLLVCEVDGKLSDFRFYQIGTDGVITRKSSGAYYEETYDEIKEEYFNTCKDWEVKIL